MSYTPGTGGRILVAVPDGITVSVTVARASGAALTVYSNVGRTATVAQPASITADTIFYVPSNDKYTVSCEVNGTECAESGSTTGVVTLDLNGDGQTTVGVDADRAANTSASSSSGASVQSVKVVACPFSFDDAGLSTGIDVYTPADGDLLIDARFSVPTAFDGTTPSADFGPLLGDGVTWGVIFEYTNNSTGIDLSAADQSVMEGVSGAATAGLAGLSGGNSGLILGANPLKVWVTQDAQAGSAAPGATQGEAVLYLYVATPVAAS